MNKRSTGWLHPAVIYLILLVLVIVVSWIGSIMEIGRGAGNEELALRSVLGVPGLRWAVRTAASCLGNAPVGNALMLFMAVGAGRGSGLFRALSRLRSLSPKETTAFYISMVQKALTQSPAVRKVSVDRPYTSDGRQTASISRNISPSYSGLPLSVPVMPSSRWLPA